MASKLEAAYDLFRRLPPAQLETNLSFVSEMLNDDDADDLLQTVDAPLKVHQASSGTFVLSDYNRDGDSYRSPIDSKYYPPLSGGVQPSGKLRKLETDCNKIFSIYAQAYYGEGAFSSCYFWDIEGGFACCILIHKDAAQSARVDHGIWDSIHVVSVDERASKYSLSTTVIVSMKNSVLDLSGSIQKQMERVLQGRAAKHIVNIGNLVQDMENSLRSDLQVIYFDKAREITRTLRQTENAALRKNKLLMRDELMAALANRRR